MHAPHYGYQPYPAPREGIAITTKYSFLTWLFAAVKPKIFVNGYETPVGGWGQSVLPLTPGQYHVHVYIPYFFPSRVGPADFTTVVYPGQFVELEYKAPLITFSRGSLGPPPQGYNGVGVMIAIAAFVVLMFALYLSVVLATHL